MPATPQVTITLISTPPSFCFIDIFKRIAHKAGAILLDTSGSTKSHGRYNIMVWEPNATVSAKHGENAIVQLAGDDAFHTDLLPFEAVKHYLHGAVASLKIDEPSQPLATQLPFIVGVAGFAGYDSGRYYEKLPENAAQTYTNPDFSVGLYLSSLIEDTLTGKVYFCSATGKTTPPDFVIQSQSSADFKDNTEHNNLVTINKQNEAEKVLDKSKSRFTLTSKWESNLSKDAYLASIQRIHDYLKAGDCYQVNMAQRFSASYIGDCWQAYCVLRDSNQAPFSAFIQLENSTIISISPERFISVKDGVVETKPIKGTRPRFSDKTKDAKSAESLLKASKDRAENLMIVDLLRNDLSKHCKPHSVNVPELFALESYEAVHHLVSTVVGELCDDASPLDLLASSFPGGSITGAPKIRAMEIIDELEAHRRNIYCGSIFYMGFREDMDSNICIRTLLAENNQLHCWAGGGIVLDSVANDEYNETLDKVSKILPVLTSHFGAGLEQS